MKIYAIKGREGEPGYLKQSVLRGVDVARPRFGARDARRPFGRAAVEGSAGRRGRVDVRPLRR